MHRVGGGYPSFHLLEPVVVSLSEPAMASLGVPALRPFLSFALEIAEVAQGNATEYWQSTWLGCGRALSAGKHRRTRLYRLWPSSVESSAHTPRVPMGGRDDR